MMTAPLSKPVGSNSEAATPSDATISGQNRLSGQRPEGDSPKSEGDSPKRHGIDTRWATYTAIGSFSLYFFGYLVLRFHLSAMGVDTDLAVLDERYFFAGAQFLVYLTSAIPICTLVALPVVILAILFRKYWNKGFERLSMNPVRLVLTGLIVSLSMIQFVERQCLPFTNLLLRDELPHPLWLQYILLDDRGSIESLYFSFLVFALSFSASLLLLAWRRGARFQQPTMALFSFLCLIQFLLLPVNFGILISNKDLARVSTITGKEPLGTKQAAWRIWDGKDTITFLLHEGKIRKLIVLDKKAIQRTEILRYEPLSDLVRNTN